MKNIYVGNLDSQATDTQLRTLFEPYGKVEAVNIIAGRGFGFVEMANDSEANAAINGLKGAQLGGRALTVNEARPKRERR